MNFNVIYTLSEHHYVYIFDISMSFIVIHCMNRYLRQKTYYFSTITMLLRGQSQVVELGKRRATRQGNALPVCIAWHSYCETLAQMS